MSLTKHRCEVCDLSFTSYQHYSIHLGGLLHNQKQRKKLEAQDDFGQRPSEIMGSTTCSEQHPSTRVDTVSTGLHSCLKKPKSSMASVSHAAVATSSQQSLRSNATVAVPQTDTLRSSYLRSFLYCPSLHESVYRDSRQMGRQGANGFEEKDSRPELRWREEQNSLSADKTTEALAKPLSSSTKRNANEKSSILALLAARRLLQDDSLREESPKNPPKAEVNSKDSVRTLLSAQFDLMKSYMTEPQKPVAASEPGRVKASPGQDLSRLKAVERSNASLSTVAGSTLVRNVRMKHSPAAVIDPNSATAARLVGQRSQGLVKTPSDFWSRQATYADEVQNDLSSIPFLGDGCAKDGSIREEQQASFPLHSLDLVKANTWDSSEDGFGAVQRNRFSDHDTERTRTDLNKRPTSSYESVSGRTWLSGGHHRVESTVPTDAWGQRVGEGAESVERTYEDECDPNLNYRSQRGEPFLSSENDTHLAHQQQTSSFRDDFRRPPLPPFRETNRPRGSAIEDFMAQVKKNLQRDLNLDSGLTSTSMVEEKTDFGRLYPVAPPLQSNLIPRKVLLKTPPSSESLGTSFDLSPAVSVSKRKILLPTPVADPTTPQSSATSLTSSSTGAIWSQPDGRGGIPSQQQPRFSTASCGGGRFSSSDSSPSLPSAGKNLAPVLQPRPFRPAGCFRNDSTSSGSTTLSSTTKKTLLSTPPVSSLKPGFFGLSSSTAGVLNLVRGSPLQALSVKSLPLSRSTVADKKMPETPQLPLPNSVKTKPIEAQSPSQALPVKLQSPSQALPVKSSPWKKDVAASEPQPASEKLEVVTTYSSPKTSSETEEVDPQLKLQKEIETVMAERVEDLMRVIPDSMMRSIMDGKVPLEFLDKISDLIPKQVIEEAVRQMEQSTAVAGSGRTEAPGTSQKPLVERQAMITAKRGTGQGFGDGAESNSIRSKMEEPRLECAAITEELSLGDKVEFVKKMIDDILGDLANESGAPSNTDALEKLVPNDRRLVLEMQDAAGIRDVSVIVEILEFFKTLNRSLILTLNMISEKEKGGGESVLKRMTGVMLKNYTGNDSSASGKAGEDSQKSPTLNSGIVTQITRDEQSPKFEITNTGLRNSVQPCVTNSSMAFGALENEKQEVQSVSVPPKSCLIISEIQAVKGLPEKAQKKMGNPEIKASAISLSQKPDIKTFSSALQVTEKTLQYASQNEANVIDSSFANASATSVGSVASPCHSDVRGMCNPQNKVVAANKLDTNCVDSNLQHTTEGNEPSTTASVAVSVEKKATAGVTLDSKFPNISHKTTRTVAGKPDVNRTLEINSTHGSNILKTPDVKSSPALQEKTTASDKLNMTSAVDKAETVERLELKGPCGTEQNAASSEESGTDVAQDIQQTTGTVASSTTTDAVTSSGAVEQSKRSSMDQAESNGLTAGSYPSLPSTQPCAIDRPPGEETSNEKAVKRKATQPDEPNKKAKLETAIAVVSVQPAATFATSTVIGLRTSYAAAVSSATGHGPDVRYASPRQGPPQQLTKPKVVLLPTPGGPPPRPVPLLPPRPVVWHKQPLSRTPFPPQNLSFQRPQLTRVVVPCLPPESVYQVGLPPAPPVQPLMPAHRQLQPSPRGLLSPPEAPRNQMPLMRVRVPPPLMGGMRPLGSPFRARNCAPINMRPLLPNANRLPPPHFVHAGDSLRLPGPELSSSGPPPFKRWR